MARANDLLYMQALDEAALKVLKAAEATKQLLQQKEEVLAEIRGEFEQKNKEVSSANSLLCSGNSSTLPACMHVFITTRVQWTGINYEPQAETC